MTNIKKLDHIAIATNNIESSLSFYAALGLFCSKTEILHDRQIKVAFIEVGNTKIELIAPLSDNSEISSFLKKKGEGIHHIAFLTSNLESDMAKLANAGTQLISDKPQAGAQGKSICFVHPKSAGNVLIELVGEKAPEVKS